MKAHLQTLVNLLTKNDAKGLLAFYQDSSESENIGQLAFMFTQAQKNLQGFEFYQQMTAQFITAKGLPKSLIARINNEALLTFFTPSLQANWHFSKTDDKGRNVLHYLMLGNAEEKIHPPFNYIRSLMLFESNEVLQDALSHRDHKDMTPLELYLAANQTLSALPNHEFTALLALIEFQSNKNAIDSRHFKLLLQSVTELCINQMAAIGPDLHRVQFLAAFYGLPYEQILARMRG